MCGIVGFIAPSTNNRNQAISSMLEVLRHRGPDDQGVHEFPGAVLGHTRLSIIDVHGGRQPIVSAGGHQAITFNGEIYGYQEIRKGLTEYPFRTQSDTEVLLALYMSLGSEMMPSVPGMFAFAIWDDERQELFAARDRFGEKPFYYAFGSSGEFIFASEIKAIIASKLVNPILCKSSLSHYLQTLYVSPDRTIYENIHCLPPGHTLYYQNGRVTINRYWSVPCSETPIDLPEASEQLRTRFNCAVKRQLVADVPVGAFLSGGLDSSSVVAAACNYTNSLQTFAFAFEGTLDESPFAETVAKQFGTQHTVLRSGRIDVADLLWQMQDVYDEPFADSSNIPTFVLSKLASEHHKVILTGDGGDELLGGYRRYKPLVWMEELSSIALWQVLVLRIAYKLSRMLRLRSASKLETLVTGARQRHSFRSVLEAHQGVHPWFSQSEIDELGLPAGTLTHCGARCTAGDDSVGSVNDAMRDDIQKYLPGDILTKIDRASMANSLELRAPFLDVDFAEFCISLPRRLKVTHASDKLVLREAFSTAWPKAIRKRSKQGFGSPVKQWLRQPKVRELTHEYLGPTRRRIDDVLPYKSVRKMAQNGDYKTWILLVLSLWMEKHCSSETVTS